MLTQDVLKKNVLYSPKTGLFTRKIANCNTVKVGDVAGTTREHGDGYVLVCVNSRQYFAHRLAWLYVHGYFPEHQIDHKNGIKNDNRIKNLREVTNKCNMQNCKLSDANTSGFTGVTFCKARDTWQAQIMIDGKYHFLGYHVTSLDAALARLSVEIQCSVWSCDYRSELISQIKTVWPGFKVPL